MDTAVQNKALKFSIIDGALSAVMGSLAGGMFLMGFAIKILKAEPQQIGLLAALPMFANLIQIFGAYIIEKTGKKKAMCFVCVLLSRALWVFIILLPLKIFAGMNDFRVWVLVGVIGFSSVFGSLSGVAWLSWMSDLVPQDIRGSYFGRRNMVASAAGMAVILLGGKFISLWESKFSEGNPFGFIILFLAALAAGVAALWFLSQVPQPQAAGEISKDRFNPAMFFRPLKDKNFLRLIIFASAWMFSVQIAAPFYGVFMIEYLKIDFSVITILGAAATLATLFMMKIWGPISDKLGNKPVIIVSSAVLVVVPFVWVIALPNHYYLPLLIAHVLSGAFMAGATLSQFNVMIKLSAQQGRSVYLALFAAITGVAGAVAPIIGGSVSELLEEFSMTVLAYNISNMHLIFFISAGLQLITIFLIFAVREPAAATPVAVIMQLRNDLNPQAGIGGTADFLMVELKRGESILRKADRVTDELAEKSEGKIKKVLDRAEKIIKKPLDKLKDFLKSD
ncbi:MAG: MFS transporter [Candidatus Omnitrophota bacterium]|nr:MAG: MFS transporter [Candidatus Omnitrophota bacterium]